GEGGAFYLDLKNVRTMYERAKIPLNAPQIPDPWTNDQPDILTWVWDPWNWPPDVDPNAEKKTMVFVHGWRMDYAEYLSWADTTYKRLWHLGYKGRFYTFRWPTYSPENANMSLVNLVKPGGASYNPSEYRAWLSGPALAGFVNQLPNANSRYLIAHSMGNVASGAALRSGMDVLRYNMCNAAMAAMAYEGSLRPDYIRPTPDTDPEEETRERFGLADKINPTSTTIASFGLGPDAAIGLWAINNALFKPQQFATAKYVYDPTLEFAPGLKLYYEERHLLLPTTYRVVTSLREAMGYVTASRTNAAGGRMDTNGSINNGPAVDMGSFGFEDEHSAEWVLTIQKTYLFWEEMMTKFQLKTAK
ncbi:MAG: alpha/beta hydrolase, partial [Chthoniobacteraceae bacterium]